jgi:hypothetical protein
MILAQAAVNIPIWSVSGRLVSSLVYLAIISGVSIAIFAVAAARDGQAGKEGSGYLWIVFTAFLYTVAEVL